MSAQILIVDDEPANLFIIESYLSEFQIITARSGKEMWERLSQHDPSIILLDVMIPGEDGFQIARELAKSEQHRDIPLIFLTARVDPVDVVTGFDVGGYDYIKKPFDADELIARIKAALKKSDERAMLAREVIIDQQTGLYNRRYLADYIARETNRIRRDPVDCSAAIIDLDFFKRINDTYGHQCGDYILASFSSIIKSTIRSHDIPFRYGGEEFLILFSAIGRNESFRVIERLKKNNEEHQYLFEGVTIDITFTCGISDLSDVTLDSDIFHNMIKRADARLYRGKESGRNRIIIDD